MVGGKIKGVGGLRRFASLLMVGLAVVALAGCYPQYDWRQVAVGNGQVRAMLPAKPHTNERELSFEGHAVTFVLTSASVDGVLFTVGYAAMPSALQGDDAARLRLLQQTQRSLYQNLGVAPPARLPAAGERFGLSGQGQGRTLRIEGMAWVTRDALIEGLVVGPADSMPHDEINEFFRELAPDLRPLIPTAAPEGAS